MLRGTDKLLFYSGTSMWPTFRPGDRLILDECDAASLSPGEVVVFRSGGRSERLVVHRVLEITRRGDEVLVSTQGDCSAGPDPLWPAHRLVGRVAQVLPVKGTSRWLKPAPFLGWRMRHRLSTRRVLRAAGRRALRVKAFIGRLARA